MTGLRAALQEQRMRDATGNDVAARQNLLELQPGALVKDIDRADREVDLVGLQRCTQVGEIAVALLNPSSINCR